MTLCLTRRVSRSVDSTRKKIVNFIFFLWIPRKLFRAETTIETIHQRPRERPHSNTLDQRSGLFRRKTNSRTRPKHVDANYILHAKSSVRAEIASYDWRVVDLVSTRNRLRVYPEKTLLRYNRVFYREYKSSKMSKNRNVITRLKIIEVFLLFYFHTGRSKNKIYRL